MKPKFPKIVYFLVCFVLIFQQSGFAQVAGELDISGHLALIRNSLIQDKFRPLHLRSLQYLSQNNSFKLLLDKGDQFPKSEQKKGLSPQGTVPFEEQTKTLLNYFFIGLSLPNDSFWVNLRPDAEDNIIDEYLSKTDIGKIMLETDLQLKKDTALATSPATPEGREYWNKLYAKAGELFGSENITIPTLTRPWIVPGEIIIRETQGALNQGLSPKGTVPDSAPSAYIYKATLKVMLEEDYLKKAENRGQMTDYTFKDPQLKALNEYSTQLIRDLIIPKLTKEVNTSKRYAPLRQVYYSLILAQWFKARYKDGRQKTEGRGQKNTVIASEPQASEAISSRIDSCNLTNLISKQPWSKTTYFQAYQKSFKDGEYNIQEPAYTPTGQVIRSFFSGGLSLSSIPFSSTSPTSGSPIEKIVGSTRLFETAGDEHVSSPSTDNNIPALAVFDNNTSEPKVIIEEASSPSGSPADRSPSGASSAMGAKREAPPNLQSKIKIHCDKFLSFLIDWVEVMIGLYDDSLLFKLYKPESLHGVIALEESGRWPNDHLKVHPAITGKYNHIPLFSFTRIFHGTTRERLNLSIFSSGGYLEPVYSMDNASAVNFTLRRSVARSFSEVRAEREKGKPIVLEFSLLELERLGYRFILGFGANWVIHPHIISKEKIPLSALTLKSKREITNLFILQDINSNNTLAKALGYSSFEELERTLAEKLDGSNLSGTAASPVADGDKEAGVIQKIFNSIAKYGILPTSKLHELGVNTVFSIDGATKKSWVNCTISYGNIPGNERIPADAAAAILFDEAIGSVQVVMERPSDYKQRIINFSDSRLKSILEERARLSALALISVDGLEREDQRYVLGHKAYIQNPSKAFEVLPYKIPLKAITTLLVPESLVSFAKEAFPKEIQIISVGQTTKSMSISRRSEGEWKDRKLALSIPDYESALIQYLSQHSQDDIITHVIRLPTTEDMQMKSSSSLFSVSENQSINPSSEKNGTVSSLPDTAASPAQKESASSAMETKPEASPGLLENSSSVITKISRQRIEQVRGLVREDKHDNIAGILVYGSVAKGTATKDSDLDYLIIKRRAFLRVSAEPAEEEFQRKMETSFSFVHHQPGGSLLLDSPLDRVPHQSFDEIILQYFVQPEGVLFFGAASRIPGVPFITDWKVIAKSDSSEAEITALIQERISVLTLRNKDEDPIKNSSPLVASPVASPAQQTQGAVSSPAIGEQQASTVIPLMKRLLSEDTRRVSRFNSSLRSGIQKIAKAQSDRYEKLLARFTEGGTKTVGELDAWQRNSLGSLNRARQMSYGDPQGGNGDVFYRAVNNEELERIMQQGGIIPAALQENYQGESFESKIANGGAATMVIAHKKLQYNTDYLTSLTKDENFAHSQAENGKPFVLKIILKTRKAYPTDNIVVDLGDNYSHEKEYVVPGVIPANEIMNLKEARIYAQSVSSPAQQKPASSVVEKEVGGIDFRALPAVSSPINPAMLKLSPAEIKRLSILNLDAEWAEMQNMLKAGIIPSNERVREYVASSCLKQSLGKQMGKVLGCIANILRMQEDRVTETEPELEGMLVLIESGKPESELQLNLAQIQIPPREPQVITP